MADNMHHMFVLMVKLCNGQTGWKFHIRFKCFLRIHTSTYGLLKHSDLNMSRSRDTCMENLNNTCTAVSTCISVCVCVCVCVCVSSGVSVSDW